MSSCVSGLLSSAFACSSRYSMSAALAAGWRRSRSQSVSVVPTSQWLSHGMMNSTLFSVREIRPVFRSIRSFGTTRCTPFEARTFTPPSACASSCRSSVHTPVAQITRRALTLISWSVSRSRTTAPVTRVPSRRKPVTLVRVATWAPYCAAVRASVIV
jgi:hypothetical protein